MNRIPIAVANAEQRKNRSVENQQLIEKRINLESQVNSETTWGNTVNRWINEQGPLFMWIIVVLRGHGMTGRRTESWPIRKRPADFHSPFS